MNDHTYPTMMQRSRFLIPARLSLLALTVALLGGCSKRESTPQESQEASVTRAEPVVAEQVTFDHFTLRKTYPGTLEGERQASVVARISETITSVPVKIGDVVHADDVVVRLDRSGAASRYRQAESSYRNVSENVNRMRALYTAGAISRQQLDDVETQFEVAQAELDAALATVDLTSPIDGIVTAIDVDPGDVTAPGRSVLTVAQVERMRIVINVREADLPFVNLGTPVEIYSELQPELRMRGEIVELARSADTDTRTFEAKAQFDNTADQWFRPGMFGMAEIEHTTPEPVISVPRPAIVHDEDRYFVYVLAGDTASRREVTVSYGDDQSLVVGGLDRDDFVITMGTNRVQDGVAVEPVEAAAFTGTSEASAGEATP